jgi:hypothetical protein
MGLSTVLKNGIKATCHKFGFEIRRLPVRVDPTQLSHQERYASPMKVAYRAKNAGWGQKLLCITHSDRPIEGHYRSLNYLEKRFNRSNRLPPTEPFETLWHISNFSPFLGQVTIWGFVNGNFSKPRLLAHLVPNPEGYKPQFATWYNNKLWILGIEGVDVYDADFSRITVITDPWLSGGHTIVPDNKGHLLVSCSGSDSILVIDENSFEVIKTFRVPEPIYGKNYSLSRQDSTVDHYIDNDSQLTHINCAWPWNGDILVSNFIQGAIGRFSTNGEYSELVRGFVGCHGTRIDHRTGQIYFCDSCVGTLVFLTRDYSIDYRIDAESTWLHDAQQLDGNIFALAVADRNQIEIVDTSSRQTIAKISGENFGYTTQFISYGK